MTEIGHNKGPTMERGAGWRRHCWQRSRQALLPSLPLPVIKRRLRRALDLGLDYKAYASVRATTGRDIVALLFSQNALRLAPDHAVPADRAARLGAVVACDRLIAAQGAPGADILCEVLHKQAIEITRTAQAPRFVDPEARVRAALDHLRAGLPGDAVLLIGETAFERSWCATGRLAGYLAADSYFPPAAPISPG